MVIYTVEYWDGVSWVKYFDYIRECDANYRVQSLTESGFGCRIVTKYPES